MRDAILAIQGNGHRDVVHPSAAAPIATHNRFSVLEDAAEGEDIVSPCGHVIRGAKAANREDDGTRDHHVARWLMDTGCGYDLITRDKANVRGPGAIPALWHST